MAKKKEIGQMIINKIELMSDDYLHVEDIQEIIFLFFHFISLFNVEYFERFKILRNFKEKNIFEYTFNEVEKCKKAFNLNK